MTVLRIDIDHDDTAADFVAALRESVALETGQEIPEILSWNISEVINPIIGENWWDWLERHPFIWANMKPTLGFLNALDRLQRAGHDVGLTTSKPRWAIWVVWKWLSNYRVPIQRVNIVVPSKNVAGEHVNKALVSDADVLVDDKPQNVEDFLAAGRRAILYRRPHNIEWNLTEAVRNPFTFADRYTRYAQAWNWQDVLAVIEEWSK